jgi:ADP-ribose pyrophosphatase YjhB (NUDIX family)
MDNISPSNNINLIYDEYSSEFDIKNNDKKLFCLNCGKNGHISKKCLCPIISIGIICVKVNIEDIDLNSIIGYSKKIQNKYLFTSDEINKLKKIKKKFNNIDISNYDNLIEYLLIRRKNSMNYVEFIRGKYDISNIDYLTRSINFITLAEKEMIQNNSFNYLWKSLWGDKNENNIEYQESYNKFTAIKNGVYIRKNDINLYFTLDKLIKDSTFKFKEPEWGFPKGRRNLREKNIECAKREFEEETSLNSNLINIINMTPVEETYLATNNLKYKHIYYISQIKNNNTMLSIDKNNINQNIEISAIDWFTFHKALSIIRDYNIEKKHILLNLHLNIKYTLENFASILENFLKDY